MGETPIGRSFGTCASESSVTGFDSPAPRGGVTTVAPEDADVGVTVDVFSGVFDGRASSRHAARESTTTSVVAVIASTQGALRMTEESVAGRHSPVDFIREAQGGSVCVSA